MANYKVYDETNFKEILDKITVDPTLARGCIPRDEVADPVGCRSYAPVANVQIIPRSEWSDRIREMRETGALLSQMMDKGNFGQRIPSLDQNGQGYCWNYSVTGAAMALRARDNLPYVRLSAHANAWMIKNGRDEGGWCQQALERLRTHGCPSVEFWPEKSMDGRRYNTPETWANAKLHVCQEWDDLPSNLPRKDRFELLMTLLLLRRPVVCDRMRWAHSTYCLDPVEIERNSFGVLDQNSWGDRWEQNGRVIFREELAVYDGAVSPRLLVASSQAR